MKRVLLAIVLLTGALVTSIASAQTGVCSGKFPNLINDVCWSCTFPIKMFGNMTLYSGGQDDFQEGSTNPMCACSNPPKVGIPESFWELDQMTDVTTVPGCFPILGGMQANIGLNADAFGYTSMNKQAGIGKTRRSFRQVNLYINPAMYLMGAILDDACLDKRGFDVPWVSFADPTHNDDELAGILTPYAFPFGSLLAIGAISADSIAATIGFPISAIFWSAGAQGSMYPLTGTNEAHLSNEQTARLQTYRILAKLHAAGTQWSEYGEGGMCGAYPQIIMDKRQYKFQRLGQSKPQTEKIDGKCCDPLGRSTILTQSGTEAPLPGFKDFSYAIFRKRDCCSGAITSAVVP